jgi:hypothetical protein
VNHLRQSLGSAGREWTPGVSDRRRNEGYSARHILHELFVTQYLLEIWEESQRDSAGLELLKTERRSLTRHSAFRFTTGGQIEQLTPDGMFLTRKRERGMICSFVEIDMGTMVPRQIQEKFRRYDAWANSNNGQHYLINLYREHGAQSPRTSFRIEFVCADLPDSRAVSRIQMILGVAESFPAVKKRLRIRSTNELERRGDL